MATHGELVERLWALSQRHTPGRVLVLVPRAVTGRWLASLLAERGAAVGVRIYDMETLLQAAMLELVGEPLGPALTLGLVREALLGDPQGRFEEIAEQPSYQREVLRAFVELERGLWGGSLEVVLAGLPGGAESRDGAMLVAFGRFREAARELGGWWRGQAPEAVVAGRRRVSFLRRRAAAVALGFSTPTTAQWEMQLLEALGFERWGAGFGSKELEGRRHLDLRLSCAGPEAEIAAVSRLLRAEPRQPAVVLAPSEAVPRWVARLRHRDVPVRAWVERRAATTAAARVARALLRVLAEPTAVRRDDLELIVFGPALRAWGALAEGLGLDYPRSPNPGDLQQAWQEQRASSFALASVAGRVRAAGEARGEQLAQRARRYGWPKAQLEQRVDRARGAHSLLAAAIEALDELAREPSAARLHALLDDWDLLARAAVHGVAGPEMTAARVVVEQCARAAGSENDEGLPGGFAALARDLDHALAGASAGSWEQSRALSGGGGPPVWVLPYESVPALGRLPERLFLTGLDGHPQAPVHHGPVSDAVRSSLGLVPDRDRFALELRILDELVASATGPVVGSWRHRDGAGARRPPGPWIAGRQDEGREQAVGVDAIALPVDETPPAPLAPLEQALVEWSADPELRRRVEAICAHEAPEVGSHTGVLGVRVDARVPYSASALQRYAALPYQYFVERVIGLRERETTGDTAASLLASEQGQVVHRALEAAHAARLAGSSTWLELASTSDALLAEVLAALAEGYRQRAEHGQAEAIWASERDRWAVELTQWWQRWQERLREAYGPSDPGRSGSRRRPPPEQLIPGMLLLAAEWSPSEATESSESSASPQPGEGGAFELDLLGLRTIPFVAAVDRVEFDPVRQRIDVVDYKTGRPRWPAQIAAELRAGVHLQLPLYALAVQQVASAAPQRLRLPMPAPVGALRLEYLQRPLPRGGKPARPEARGFAPNEPLGLDAEGQVWTIIQAAASFSVAFVSAIEAGRFPVVARAPTRRYGPSRIEELARVVPSADERRSGLPPGLEPLPDPRAAREVVR
jgi:RecB family exonuclease